MKDHYPVFILWSEDEECFLANVVDLPGCIADGKTREAALANAEAMAKDWVETAKSLGRKIPRPSTDEAFQAAASKQQQKEQEQFEAAVHHTVSEIIKKLLPKLEARYFQSSRRGIFPNSTARIPVPVTS
jgi:predicted RNase H-like HicB family nuclease